MIQWPAMRSVPCAWVEMVGKVAAEAPSLRVRTAKVSSPPRAGSDPRGSLGAADTPSLRWAVSQREAENVS